MSPSTGATKRRRSLSFRLIVVFVSILSVVIVVLTAASVTMLRSYLTTNLDDELTSSGTTIANELVKGIDKNHDSTAPGFDEDLPADDQASLSDYFFYAQVAVPSSTSSSGYSVKELQRVSNATYGKYGTPKSINTLLKHTSSEPFTVSGTAPGVRWRTIVLPVVQGRNNQIGTVVIARPLTPVLATVTAITTGIVLTALAVVAFGAVLAYALIRSSLKPLRGIEHATHKIAAGDLSQRVPNGKEGSEVAHLADSINVMLEQIEHSFEVKERSEAKMRQFVSDASHELRTPLATVRGYAELYRIGGVPTDKVPATMERMESEAKRMTGLVEDLLQLARLDEGRPLNFVPTCVTEISLNAVMDFRVRANNWPAVVVGLDGGTPPNLEIIADPDKVTQIISNLLSNVLTHTPEGTPVEVAVGRVGEEAVVEVRDHGPGVSSDDADHLFERFYRADYSRSRASGGSGLGLAIVASIMQAHGGSAEAAQTPGGGLTIRLRFPLTKPVG